VGKLAMAGVIYFQPRTFSHIATRLTRRQKSETETDQQMPHESPQKPPRGLTAIAVFLLFGAAMALLAGATMIFPGLSSTAPGA